MGMKKRIKVAGISNAKVRDGLAIAREGIMELIDMAKADGARLPPGFEELFTNPDEYPFFFDDELFGWMHGYVSCVADLLGVTEADLFADEKI